MQLICVWAVLLKIFADQKIFMELMVNFNEYFICITSGKIIYCWDAVYMHMYIDTWVIYM